MSPTFHVVTGSLGYTGRSLTEQLLARGVRIRTLTNSPGRPNPFGSALEIRPLAFGDPAGLAASMRDEHGRPADVLYNTYWVRFNHRLFSFDDAVRNTKVLFEAARLAGVGKVVHVSILHADEAGDLAYYRGKHELEVALKDSGMRHSIIRPGVLFGRFDILINNIAWVLRRLPVFGVFGDGSYRLRPMHVDDMAALMVEHAIGPHAHAGAGTIIDAVGPETFTYRELVTTLAGILHLSRPIIAVPPGAGYAVSRLLNPIVGDVIITREEIKGLMRGLLDSPNAATGSTRVTEWARAHASELGVKYASEIGRRTQRDVAYGAVR